MSHHELGAYWKEDLKKVDYYYFYYCSARDCLVRPGLLKEAERVSTVRNIAAGATNSGLDIYYERVIDDDDVKALKHNHDGDNSHNVIAHNFNCSATPDTYSVAVLAMYYAFFCGFI